MSDLEKGFEYGRRIARLSVVTLLALGVIEIGVGRAAHSIGLQSDGVDSLSDATISFIVWLGLRYSSRSPDRNFNFGYLKVENFSAFVASLGMVAAATAILYFSYLKLLHPSSLDYGALAIATLLGAGVVSLYRAVQVRRIANRYNLLSLRTDANNSIKDATASFLVAGAVLAAAQGYLFMDAVGGIVISGYIYTVAYVSIRESSLVLLDSFSAPELLNEVRGVVEGKYSMRVAKVRLRRAGPYIMGTIVVLADEKLTLAQAHDLKNKMRSDLKDRIRGIGMLSLDFYPSSARPEEVV